ncbi:MAG: Hpt domain-containing protein, partial [Chitinispirillia bacterium]|nr:Hpt domain-containing protein [Chitinispirillia bacterium]
SGSFDALVFADELRGMEGMEELVEKIEDYDFDEALKLLVSIKENGLNQTTESENPFWDKLQNIGDINIEIGFSRVSNVESMYRDNLEFFYKKLNSQLDSMSSSLKDGDLALFSITVHAMKSSLSTIGAMELSNLAADLEAAAKSKKEEYCAEKYPSFKKRLTALDKQLEEVFQIGKTVLEKEAGDRVYLIEAIKKAAAAAEDFDSDLGLEILNPLRNFDFGEKDNETIEKAADAFSDFEFEAACGYLGGIQA